MMSDKYVTYAHKDAPNGARYRDLKDRSYPAWAVDIKDEPAIVKLMNPYSLEWELAANRLARSWVNIVACRDCGSPVVSGYCCNTCESTLP